MGKPPGHVEFQQPRTQKTRRIDMKSSTQTTPSSTEAAENAEIISLKRQIAEVEAERASLRTQAAEESEADELRKQVADAEAESNRLRTPSRLSPTAQILCKAAGVDEADVVWRIVGGASLEHAIGVAQAQQVEDRRSASSVVKG